MYECKVRVFDGKELVQWLLWITLAFGGSSSFTANYNILYFSQESCDNCFQRAVTLLVLRRARVCTCMTTHSLGQAQALYFYCDKHCITFCF